MTTNYYLPFYRSWIPSSFRLTGGVFYFIKVQKEKVNVDFFLNSITNFYLPFCRSWNPSSLELIKAKSWENKNVTVIFF